MILFVVKMVFSFIHETRQLNQSIREEGGMRCVCSTLVDGLLAYRGARVVKEDSNSISIDGHFMIRIAILLADFGVLAFLEVGIGLVSNILLMQV